jgi:hypothetical protein
LDAFAAPRLCLDFGTVGFNCGVRKILAGLKKGSDFFTAAEKFSLAQERTPTRLSR